MNELELECELEAEFEDELEAEFEDELEGEEFLGDAWRWLTREGSTQRKVALNAAKAALKGGATAGGAALGGLAGGGVGAPIGGVLGGTLGAGLAGLLPDKELMAELEAECEGEACSSSIDAAMEHLGDMACRARTPREAEAFIGALVPLAAKLIPRAASVIQRAAPRLIRSVSSVARTLRRSPATRHLVRSVPTIVRRAAVDMARQAAKGRVVTPQKAVRTVAKHTARTIARPNTCRAALQRCRALNRAYVARLRSRQRR